ncbi:hypothetical protein CK203_117643 [Vitis vinifera]|uniref:Uncharacterized protein n=1 Tax=Vitis vinifera TaxID=29760 RepID=A0A438C4K6_VITVI|nr:hypothetical protein CK203_117643 [Vitis vinifera]
MFEAIQYLISSKKSEDGFGMDNVAVVNDFLSDDMFGAIQYLVSSNKLEDGFGMDNVAVV